MACHHLPRTANTVEQRRGLHAITAFGQHTQSDDVGRAMQSSHLGSTDRQTASGVASHHRPWTAQMVDRRRAWNAIIALGQHTRSAMSGEALNHRPWTVHTVKRRPSWHDITDLGLHARLDDVGCGMTSPPLNSTQPATSRVAGHHHPWTTHTVVNVGCGMTSPPLDRTHGRTTSGVS